MSNAFPNLTLVLGGARSGKSLFAERLVMSTGRPRVYVATAQPFDSEMQDRISEHKRQRGENWETREATTDIADALEGLTSEHIVLLDCLTLWLNNVFMAETSVEEAIEALLEALRACPAPIVCVSNEIGLGLVPENALGRKFRDAQGMINRRVAEHADLAVFVAAGLPLVLKGALPDGAE